MRRPSSILIFLLCLCLTLQAEVYSTRIFHPNIRTLRVQTLSQWQAGQDGYRNDPFRPILLLDGAHSLDGSDPDNTLEISFDELSHDPHMYSYTVLHLNHDGQRSELQSSEYLRGFTTMDITDYATSLNTSQLYTHYRLSFPNDDMQLTRSGQYALVVYEDGRQDQPVLIVNLYIVEPQTKISTSIRSNTDIEYNGRYQQLDLDISTGGLDVRDPSDIRLVITQNGRTDNAVINPRPSFVEPNRLRYINHKGLIFEGGSPYHHFDTYSTYYAGTGVNMIRHDRVDYHAFLLDDEVLATRPYVYELNANGQQMVHAERVTDEDTEAEYMWVHWTLPAEQPWFDGTLYVGGDIFNNRMTAENRMQYDADHHCYWLNALVKQGGADYQYWFVRKGEKTATTQRVEGSHWQTPNEYRIYVYYRPIGGRADQLIGVQTIIQNDGSR